MSLDFIFRFLGLFQTLNRLNAVHDKSPAVIIKLLSSSICWLQIERVRIFHWRHTDLVHNAHTHSTWGYQLYLVTDTRYQVNRHCIVLPPSPLRIIALHFGQRIPHAKKVTTNFVGHISSAEVSQPARRVFSVSLI